MKELTLFSVHINKRTQLTLLILLFSFYCATSNAQQTISIQSTLYELIADPTRPYIYASDSDNNSVLFINRSTQQVERSVFVGSMPTDMDIDDDSSHLYVAITGGSSVAVIDLETQSATTPVDLGFSSPGSLATGRSDRIYVSKCRSGYPDTTEIVIFNTDTGETVSSFPGGAVHAVDSTGNSIYVTDDCSFSYPNIEKWDISTDNPSLLLQEHLWGGGCNWSAVPQLELSPDDLSIYLVPGLSDCGANADGIVPVHNVSNFLKAGQLMVEYSPNALALNASGGIAYVSHNDTVLNANPRNRHNRFRKDVHVFNTDTYVEETFLATRNHVAANGLEVDPDGTQLFAITGDSPSQNIEVICLSNCPELPPEDTFTIIPIKSGGAVIVPF